MSEETIKVHSLDLDNGNECDGHHAWWFCPLCGHSNITDLEQAKDEDDEEFDQTIVSECECKVCQGSFEMKARGSTDFICEEMTLTQVGDSIATQNGNAKSHE